MKTPRFKKHAITLVFALAVLPIGRVFAQDAPDCTTALADAESAYFSGDFENTIALLQPCITADAFAGHQGIRAYALLGRTHFVLGNDDNARTAIEGLYVLNPTYTPDPQLPPNFSAFILEVKQQMIASGQFPETESEVVLPTPEPPAVEIAENDEDQAAPRRRKALLFGGGAALVVVAGAAILLSGGGGENPTDTGWPLPPPHPSSQ
ncbi:MAG: hypothetical protein AAF564_17080 [Bacteroidota bacterium]